MRRTCWAILGTYVSASTWRGWLMRTTYWRTSRARTAQTKYTSCSTWFRITKWTPPGSFRKPILRSWSSMKLFYSTGPTKTCHWRAGSLLPSGPQPRRMNPGSHSVRLWFPSSTRMIVWGKESIIYSSGLMSCLTPSGLLPLLASLTIPTSRH